MNDVWQTLGIAPTADESAIKKAYAKALKHNKPDKNPEGFKALREAYETALATRFYYVDDDSNDDDDTVFDDTGVDDTTIKDKTDTSHTNTSYIKPDTPITQNHVDELDNAGTSNLQDLMPADTFFDKNGNESDETSKPNDETSHAPPSSSWYVIDDLPTDEKDEALLNVLHDQVSRLDTQTLDERTEYEQELIDFFVWHDDDYPQSFRWAFGTFAWQEIVNSWHIERYPWHHLDDLQERYRYVAPPFSTYQQFYDTLSVDYPAIFAYYYHKKPKTWVTFAWHFIKQSFYPERLMALAYELEKMNEILTYQSKEHSQKLGDDHLYHNILFHDKQYRWLNDFVFKGIFRPIPLLLMFVGLSAIGSITSLLVAGDLSWFLRHILPSVLLILIFMAFWQCRWYLFVNPSRFIYQDGTNRRNPHFFKSLYISLPLVFASIFVGSYQQWKAHEVITDGTTNITTLYDKPSYFIAHLAGLGLWYSLMRANLYPVFSIQGYWYVIFVISLTGLVLPMLKLISQTDIDIVMAYTPLFWVFACIPILVHLLQVHKNLPKLESVSNFTLRVLLGFSVLFLFFVGINGLFMLWSLPLLGVLMMFGTYCLFKSMSENPDEST